MRILNFNTKSISQQDEVSILVIELIERLVPSTTGSSGLRGSFSFSQSRRRGFGSHDQKFRNNHLGEKSFGTKSISHSFAKTPTRFVEPANFFKAKFRAVNGKIKQEVSANIIGILIISGKILLIYSYFKLNFTYFPYKKLLIFGEMELNFRQNQFHETKNLVQQHNYILSETN